MVKDVRQLGDPMLRQKAKHVGNLRGRRDISGIVRDMVDTMFTFGGIGIAAPQIGVSLRIIIAGNRHGVVMVNPEILTCEGNEVAIESCLSIPGYAGEVDRAQRIRVRWETERGQSRTAWFDGAVARVIQHEVDHLNGTLFIDLIAVKTDVPTSVLAGGDA